MSLRTAEHDLNFKLIMKDKLNSVITITKTGLASKLGTKVRKDAIKMISPSNTKVFLAVLKGLRWRLTSLSLHSSKRKILPKIRLTARFISYLLSMNRRHGTTYVVKYLKASQLAVQRYLAGNPLKSLRELEPDLPLPRLSSRGLPTIILSRDLALLGNKGEAVCRFYLTMFSLYRIIEIPAKVKLSTITDPFKGSSDFLQNFIAGVPNGIISLNNFA